MVFRVWNLAPDWSHLITRQRAVDGMVLPYLNPVLSFIDARKDEKREGPRTPKALVFIAFLSRICEELAGGEVISCLFDGF